MNLTVQLDSSAATAAIGRLRGAFAGALRTQLHSEMGLAVELLVTKQMRTTVATKPNALGAPSTGFWKKAIASVNVTANSAAAQVNIPYRGVALQYFGGVVRPVNKRALTIPIAAAAHGKTVGDFDHVFKIPSHSGDPSTVGVLGREVGGQFQALFILRTSATIKPHPEILPQENDMLNAASDAAQNWIARQLP